MNELRANIIRAFWHRTRRVFVPLTTPELARKIKADPDKVALELWALSRVGSTSAIKAKGNSEPSTWHLTRAGEAEARAMFTADAFANGGNA